MTAGDGGVPAGRDGAARRGWHGWRRSRRRAKAAPQPWPSAAQRAAGHPAAGHPAAGHPAAGHPADSAAADPSPPPTPPPLDLTIVPQPARPRIEIDPGLLGLTRRSHSRIGSRLFTLFFVFVFVLIVVQMLVVLLGG